MEIGAAEFVVSALLIFPLVTAKEELCVYQKHEPYEDSVQQCCEDIGIQPLFDKSGKVHCCGNTTFSEQSKFCCNKTVHNVMKNKNIMACCDKNTLYIKDEYMCCKGRIHTKTPSELECCGNGVYNVTNQMCCDDDFGNYSTPSVEANIYCCSSSYYDASTHDCIKSYQRYHTREVVVPRGHGLCDGIVYDRETSLCCDADQRSIVLHRNTSGSDRCCGANLYSSETQRCCQVSSSKFVAPKNATCCGNSYAMENQICCNMKVMNASDEQNCCLGQLYSSEMDCCHGDVYNRSEAQCCDGSLLSRGMNCSQRNRPESFRSQTLKCGIEEYDKDWDRCCNYKLYKNVKKIMKCCGTSTILYNTKTQRCRQSVVHDRGSVSVEEYGICKFCRWTEEDFLKKMYQGEINICQKEAMMCTVEGRVKLPSKLIFKVTTKQNIFNPLDHWAKGNTMRLYLPCKCSKLGNGHKIFVVTNTPLIKKRIKLGDSDLFLRATAKIKSELVRQKLLCNIGK